MAENSHIEWTDHTFNPWIGCSKISPGCDHCYAETWDNRWGNGWGPHQRRRTSAANWRKPLAWDRDAAAAGVRARVFCASLSDVFDNDRAITSGWRGDLWHLIHRTPNLDWLLLTKRPQNLASYLCPEEYGDLPKWGDGWPNVWLGTTVENQTEADRRIPHLLATPAAVRFLSCEPLLGPVDLTSIERRGGTGFMRPLDGRFRTIDWVICGGESGPGARPMHPDWARSLRDQCDAAGVPFFFKQWGDWMPWEMRSAPMWQAQDCRWEDGNVLFPTDMDNDPRWDDGLNEYEPGVTDHCAFERVGKRAAGRKLDGREWNDMPGREG